MKNRVSNEELKLLGNLQREGVPFDGEVLEDLKAASRGLSIYQTGSILENTVFDLNFGGSGYMISLVIANDADTVICPHEFRLEIPWHEPQFRWLEDPSRKSPREYTYSFPRRGPEGFERSVVLNHRLGRKGKLNPGGELDGLLLGVGQAPIPDEYSDRRGLLTRLSIFDERGNCYESDVELLVIRERQRKGGRAKEGLGRARTLSGKCVRQGIERICMVPVPTTSAY